MIIVLKGADFSANNIGQVTLPISSEVEELLTNFSKTLTNKNKAAVQTFFTAINGFKSKIKALYLPVLAGQLDECFINCMDTTDVISITSTNFELTSRGVRKPSTATAKILDIPAMVGENTSDIHYLTVFAAENITGKLPTYPMFPDANNRFVIPRDTYNNTVYQFSGNSKIGGTACCDTTNLYKDITLNSANAFIFSGYGNNSFIYKNTNGGVTTKSGYSSLSHHAIEHFYIDSTSGYMCASHSVISCGKGLTESETTAFYNAAIALHDAIAG